MTGGSGKELTAEELMAQLEADPEWVARRDRQEHERQRAVKANRRDADRLSIRLRFRRARGARLERSGYASHNIRDEAGHNIRDEAGSPGLAAKAGRIIRYEADPAGEPPPLSTTGLGTAA